jgi:hypothetical protein
MERTRVLFAPRHLISLLATLLVLSPAALRAGSAIRQDQIAGPLQASSSGDPAVAAAQYRHALAEYTEARQRYMAVAEAYWAGISEKRHLRMSKRANHEAILLDDYVLAQPPVYSGPPRPRDPLKPQENPPSPYVPVVSDFLAAAQREFKFVPRLPRGESEFKHAYARAALAAGLTRDQIVRIYGFEAGGNGGYDVQAGLEYNKKARAITTALGYNQLLATNTVEIVAENGNQFVKKLSLRAGELSDDERQALDIKIAVLRKMVSYSTSVPDAWSAHETLANTSKGLAIHAMNLDLDLGPLLQAQKLMDSVIFARRKGFDGTLTAADLEMMNLTGDGNGFDMVTLPAEWRDKVPTANFFQRSGYLDNPVAQRNSVVGKLLAATAARMDEESRKPGARELAAALQ